jgi:hypothetical protein
MLLRPKHYTELSFWEKQRPHFSFPNALRGCALTATTSLNVAKLSKERRAEADKIAEKEGKMLVTAAQWLGLSSR